MRILLDTNVLVDVYSKRHPFYEDSATVLSLFLNSRITGCVATSFPIFISRNARHFIHAAIPVLSPTQFVQTRF